MESEKVKEIKKALEDCASNEIANRLPYIDDHKCKAVDFADILTLINELDSENERLLNEKWNCQDDLDNYHEENQPLKDRIAELENTIKNNLQYAKGYGDGVKATVEVAYPKKLKQFSERLKEKAIRRQEFIGELAIDNIEYVKTQDIDETLKEFLKS